MPKIETPLGHITFRLKPEHHRQLREIAEIYGVNLSCVLQELVAQQLPRLQQEAAFVLESQKDSKRALEKAQKGSKRAV